MEANNLDVVKEAVLFDVRNVIKTIEDIKARKPGLKLLEQVEGVSGGSVNALDNIFKNYQSAGGITIKELDQLRSTILTIERNAPVAMKEVGYALRKITRATGEVTEHQITPRIEYALELYAKKGFHKAFREDEKQTDLFYLAHECLKTAGVVVKPFGSEFLDTLVKVEVLDDEPLD